MSEPSMLTLDDVRKLIAKTDALSHAAEYEFDNLVEPDRRSLERVSHLVSAAAEAATAALAAADQLAAASGRR
jgi:hypothetical protein